MPPEHDGAAAGGTAARTIICTECDRPWLYARERWRLFVTDDDVPETGAYCPECAVREFGEHVTRRLNEPLRRADTDA